MQHETPEELAARQAPVQIRRDLPEDSGLDGRLVAVSPELLVVAEWRDFLPYGFTAVRRRDVTCVHGTPAVERHARWIDESGQDGTQGASPAFRPSGWEELLRELRGRGEWVVVEDELAEDPLFLLGPIVDVTPEAVTLDAVDVELSRRDREQVEFERITLVSWGGPYVRMYQRQSER